MFAHELTSSLDVDVDVEVGPDGLDPMLANN